MAILNDVLKFWFDDPAVPNSEYGQERRIWFHKNPAFDQQVRDQYLNLYAQARQGLYDHWTETPQGALALILVFDQFPRNMFRGTARSFEADEQALAIAQTAIARQYDRALIPIERIFLYLPLEHSEDLSHQNQCVALLEALVQEAPTLQKQLEYTYRHRDVIAQFGRFPHRNEILGRVSTPAELEFLQKPGSRF